MVKYVIKRVLLAIMTAIIILSLTFILIKLLKPERVLGDMSARFTFYEEQVRLGYMMKFSTPMSEFGELQFWFQSPNGKSDLYYYQVPVMTQYVNWIRNIITAWDWGVSQEIEQNVKVTVIIGEQELKEGVVKVLTENEEIKFALGETENTHDLTIALQKASTALQYTVAIRDKVIEAYRELMQMQI